MFPMRLYRHSQRSTMQLHQHQLRHGLYGPSYANHILIMAHSLYIIQMQRRTCITYAAIGKQQVAYFSGRLQDMHSEKQMF
jgi:hypothetical protein